VSTIRTTNFQHPSATDPAIVLAADGTASTTVSSVNGGALAGMRNRIINGGMDIAQRGTSFAAIADDAYSMDRWQWGQGGAMVCTVTQSTDVPNNTFQSSCKVDVTTVDSSIAADDRANIQQTIEGYNVRDLIGTTFTLSFWVKSPKTGTHCISFRNGIPDRSFVKEYTIISANSWEYKTLTISGGLITAGTWNWTSGRGLYISFTLACGSTYQTTADAWQTGNFIATANQVNVMDNTANDFFITGVQLEPGAVATPFERRIFGQELALCQRYFCKSYDLETAPGTVTTNGELRLKTFGGGNSSSSVEIFYPVTMRGLPTITSYSPDTGTSGQCRRDNVDQSAAAASIGQYKALINTNSANTDSEMRAHFTASAEL
jgi:hypothetical protein